LAITAKELHTASELGTITDGTVVIVDGRIAAVGKDVVVPWNAQRIHVDTLTPGFIDCLGQAGFRGYRDLGDGAIIPGSPLPVQPLDIAPSTLFDPEFPDVRAAAEAGVTSLVLAPRSGRPISGQFSIVKTHGDPDSEFVLRAMGGLLLDYQVPPSTEANKATLGGFLKDALAYHESFKKYDKEKAEFDKKNVKSDVEPSISQRVVKLSIRRQFKDFTGQWEGRVYGGVLPPGGMQVRVTIEAATETEATVVVELLTGEAETLNFTLKREGRHLRGTLTRQEVSIRVDLLVWRGEANGSWSTKEQTGSVLLVRSEVPEESDAPAKDTEKVEKPEKPEKEKTSTESTEKPAEKPKDAGSKEEKKAPEPPKAPKRTKSKEPLIPIIKGDHPLYISVRSKEEVADLLQVTRSDYDVRTVVMNPEYAPGVLETLESKGAALLVTPNSVRREKGAIVNPAALAVAKGIPVVLGSGQTGDSRGVYVAASYLVRCGLGRTEALKAMTAWAALVLNIGDRVGSIEVGKDADLTMITGRLFEPGSVVSGSIIDGKVIKASNKH
jgi:imidazolonepropionase-like amidohydrolase